MTFEPEDATEKGIARLTVMLRETDEIIHKTKKLIKKYPNDAGLLINLGSFKKRRGIVAAIKEQAERVYRKKLNS